MVYVAHLNVPRSCKLTRIITPTYNNTTMRTCNWPCVYLSQAHKLVVLFINTIQPCDSIIGICVYISMISLRIFPNTYLCKVENIFIALLKV